MKALNEFVLEKLKVSKIKTVYHPKTREELVVLIMEPRWIPLEEAISVFSKYQDYADKEEKRGMYLREYKALSAYLNASQCNISAD